MTVVNTATGEIIEYDRSAAERRAERIRLRLDNIADNYAAVMPMIREAIQQRDDIALGYRSPGDYVRDRFGGALQRLGVDVRRAVVHELTEAGLSTRAIAPVVGVSDRQVRYDAAQVGNEFPPAQAPESREVSNLDTPATVTGIDGKTYARPDTPRTPPRRPITDTFFDANFDLRKQVERIHRITQDDRFPQNAEKVAAKHRNDLIRTRDLLQQVIESLSQPY